MQSNIDALEFTPINRYMSFDNDIQIAEGVFIIERICFPWNIFKNVSVCLLFPIKPIMNGIIDGKGFGTTLRN
jgi:hypothetical protein